MIQEWSPAALVVGLPPTPTAPPHEMTGWRANLPSACMGAGLPVWLVDERHSLQVAEVQAERRRPARPPAKAGAGPVAAQVIFTKFSGYAQAAGIEPL